MSTLSSTSVFIGYSPNDFFYNNAMSSGDPYAPNDKDCAELKDKKLGCDHDNFNKNFNEVGFKCIQQEMCKNKELAESLSIQFQNNGGPQKFGDLQYSFRNSLLKSINLGLGICSLMYFIYSRRNINM